MEVLPDLQAARRRLGDYKDLPQQFYAALDTHQYLFIEVASSRSQLQDDAINSRGCNCGHLKLCGPGTTLASEL